MRTIEQQREYQADMDQASMSQGEYMSEALHQYAAAHGEDRPDQAWILSPFDTWESNPFYNGPAGAPHPEDEAACEEWCVVGQHAVNLYEADKQDRLDAAWLVGDDMVRKWEDVNDIYPDFPF